MKKRIIYYSDDINEDVVNIKRKTINIDENYKYIRKNIFYKICQFIVYDVCVKPFAFIYMKIKFNHKTLGKEKLKKYKKSGYFLYSNHSLLAGDAFIPNIIEYPKKTKIIVHPDNLSIPAKVIVEMCGAIPIPSTLRAGKNFINSIEHYINKGHIIQIYPEAHVWPYYTKIRPYISTSFKYPIKFKTPTFVSTNTFQKRKFFKTPKIITYIDGPFFPEYNLIGKDIEEDLRNKVYNIMCERSKNSNYEYYTYIKRSKE